MPRHNKVCMCETIITKDNYVECAIILCPCWCHKKKGEK
jgi:hypothetical protein